MPDAFAQIVETLDGAMVVVTATYGAERSGCLVGFHTQCSIDPRRWLVCVSKANHTLRIALGAGALAVHVLREDQRGLAELFGETTDDSVDKFARCAWHAGPFGTAILDGCDVLAGPVLERVDLGDHIGHLVDVVLAERHHVAQRPLGFQAVRGLRPGHPP